MRVLAFEAHPDDVEHFCAGTLAKYSSLGHSVGIACLTNGEVGHPTMKKKEIAAVREKEARNSAKIINADFYWLGYHDEFLFNTPEFRLNVINTIRSFKPDIIITLDKDNDYHPDHTTTGQVVWDTHVMVTVPNIDTQHPPCEKIPEIFFCDTSAGINFVPELYVDITDYWDTKAKMIACHESQETWIKDQYGDSLIENSRKQSVFRGYQAGCDYAECFRKPKFYPQKTNAGGLLT